MAIEMEVPTEIAVSTDRSRYFRLLAIHRVLCAPNAILEGRHFARVAIAQLLDVGVALLARPLGKPELEIRLRLTGSREFLQSGTLEDLE